MSRKRYRPEEIIAKLREAGSLLSQGTTFADALKAIEIHEVTYYHWSKEHHVRESSIPAARADDLRTEFGSSP